MDDLFRAQLALELWEGRRRFCARLVIILSASLAFCVWRGVGFADRPARFGLLLWAFSFTAWGVSMVGSLVTARAMDRLVARAGGRCVATEGRERG